MVDRAGFEAGHLRRTCHSGRVGGGSLQCVRDMHRVLMMQTGAAGDLQAGAAGAADESEASERAASNDGAVAAALKRGRQKCVAEEEVGEGTACSPSLTQLLSSSLQRCRVSPFELVTSQVDTFT